MCVYMGMWCFERSASPRGQASEYRLPSRCCCLERFRGYGLAGGSVSPRAHFEGAEPPHSSPLPLPLFHACGLKCLLLAHCRASHHDCVKNPCFSTVTKPKATTAVTHRKHGGRSLQAGSLADRFPTRQRDEMGGGGMGREEEDGQGQGVFSQQELVGVGAPSGECFMLAASMRGCVCLCRRRQGERGR